MLVLGIETSCDETAAAVVSDDADPGRRIRANRVLSQLDEHSPYGGVVPEIAARAHLDHLERLIREAMAEAGIGFAELDGIAFSGGPGLIGGLLVGATMAKAVALVHGLKLSAVNHLEAHALTVRLGHDTPFPYLLLLVSGGHCQLLIVEGVGRYRRLGTTIDDAAGECFDKCAKLMGLGYPGGPALERAARQGEPKRFDLPRPLKGRAGCDFSFSGLKTAVRRAMETLGAAPAAQDIADLAAATQAAIGDSLIDRTRHAIESFRELHPQGRHLVVAGGVAANQSLRLRLEGLAAESGLDFVAPALALCTDNAAMVAWAGIERLRLGLTDDIDFAPRPRWPLDPAAPKAIGAGVKA